MLDQDPIEELRAQRAALAKRFGFDISKLASYYNQTAAALRKGRRTATGKSKSKPTQSTARKKSPRTRRAA